MKRLLSKVLVLGLVIACAASRANAQRPNTYVPTPTRESAATLVVYNNLDPASAGLAAYYAKRRAIPLDHIVGLNCSINEEITRADYDETIAKPLRRLLTERGWWHAPPDPSLPVSDNQIRFVVLMRGIPLKIAGVANYPGDSFTAKAQELNTNAAAVDSELATLGMRANKISGAMKNPYYQSFTPFMDTPLAPFMLVCRLDGPTVAIVENMIDGAMTVEHRGLYGFAYMDLRGITTGNYAEGDQWLATATVELRQFGMPVIWDNALYPPDFPMDHAAIYLGWYTDNVNGPIARSDFRFVPGAIAVHIHSFSAATVRDANSHWVGPILAHGAAATLGNVYEPYLDLTPHLDVFVDRLRNGLNFAESAYASVPALSWMTTFVGDPLYRPFGEMDEPLAGSDERPVVEYESYKEGAHTWYQKGRTAGEKQLAASARRLNSGIVWEGLGLLQWSVPDPKAAFVSFQQAQKCYGTTEDGLRTVLHQVEILKWENNMVQARDLATKALTRYDAFHGTELLRELIGLPPSTASTK
jgi:uncharacterized protein (TIGR03790 family)